MTSVPRLFPGGTVVCIASGPSLTPEDVEYCRGKVDGAIVVNTSFRMAPWADALVASDLRWWGWHYREVMKTFPGLKYATSKGLANYKGVQILRNTGGKGLETDPTGIRHGMNSGYRAVNLAYHFGATRILLLGYDMSRGEGPERKEHWHGDHPVKSRSPYDQFRRYFATIVEPLQQAGVELVNCSRRTALECVPVMPLEEALSAHREAVAS